MQRDTFFQVDGSPLVATKCADGWARAIRALQELLGNGLFLLDHLGFYKVAVDAARYSRTSDLCSYC